MTLQVSELVTALGPLTVATDGGSVVASGFGGSKELLQRLGTRDQTRSEQDPGPGQTGQDLDSGSQLVAAAELPDIAAAVSAYFSGDLDALNSIPVRQTGTPLQEGVWQVLRLIPAGQTWSYGQIAAAIGRPAAVRAVGQACGANLVAPFVPCHRAVRSDGSLGGYAYGLTVKQWLLKHEGVVVPIG